MEDTSIGEAACVAFTDQCLLRLWLIDVVVFSCIVVGVTHTTLSHKDKFLAFIKKPSGRKFLQGDKCAVSFWSCTVHIYNVQYSSAQQLKFAICFLSQMSILRALVLLVEKSPSARG